MFSSSPTADRDSHRGRPPNAAPTSKCPNSWTTQASTPQPNSPTPSSSQNITAMVSRKPGVILTHLPSAIQIQVIGRIEPDTILLNGKMQMRTSGIAGLP